MSLQLLIGSLRHAPLDDEMKPQIKALTLPDGTRLQAAESGKPHGIPVLLLHGVTDSWHSFEPVLPHLPPSIRAVALTQRGHGDSDRPRAGYRTRDFAADAAAALDQLGIERCVVVGHSMGSANAMRFAIDFPRRTAGLVLAGAFASFRRNASLVEFWETSIRHLTDPVDEALARDFQLSTVAQDVAPEFIELAIRESLKAPARVWREAFAEMLEDDFAADVERIAAPTLIVWGARDALCPRSDQIALKTAIAGARLCVYDAAGHAVHWDEPARFAADLAAFVLRLDQGPASTLGLAA
jgi:pimeloyl-ACP methyl ester carboxylesterase